MGRAEYARYILARFLEALTIAAGAATLLALLQKIGAIPPFNGVPSRLTIAGPAAPVLVRLEWWVWPTLSAALAHVILGPKQSRPIYLRIPGALYVYAGVKVDRNAGCRGALVTGATGSGKTLACILPRLHSLCVNEAGLERAAWKNSPQESEYTAHRNRIREQREALERRIKALSEADRDPSPAPKPGPKEEPGAFVEAAERLRLDSELALQGLQQATDPFRRARYQVPPWGGYICGEKGNEWQMIESLLRCHGRPEDLCLLRTRPSWAPPHWKPPVRFNLLSLRGIPADTYAKLIVDSGLSSENATSRDEFFVPQARDKIAWGIRLVRSVEGADCSGTHSRDRQPSLLTLLDILTVQESYRQYLLGSLARRPRLSESEDFLEARFQLENNYWNQPPDQLGGVRSTLYNFLVAYAEPEIAEVFCSESTFDLYDIEQGKVVCLAIPQKLSVQRRYVSTLIKSLVYQVILDRFDRRQDHPDWLDRNVIVVEQDEWQRHAVQADCEVDIVREARGAVHAAVQSQNAVWPKLGGKEAASGLIANLRNRWICQAATEECAEESSRLIGERVGRTVSYTYGHGGRTTNLSFPERSLIARHQLRALAPFHVIFAPAEGRWLYRRCIAMPATADGKIPAWWFGDWNPFHWLCHGLGLPEKLLGLRLHPGGALIPPWRACAPFRAQVRRLIGLDGTFIILGGVKSKPDQRSG